MKSLALFFVAAIGQEIIPQEDVYGPREVNAEMERWADRIGISSVNMERAERYFDVRTPSNCVFPLEVVILQDATESFADDLKAMKKNQLKQMVDALSESHPDSKFGIASFRDKPIGTLGGPSDYCVKFEQPLTHAYGQLVSTYNHMTAVGGADPAENQYGALLATAQSMTPGWSDNSSLATRIIVVSTDANQHYDADGKNDYGMTPFNGDFDEANAAAQCLAEYYPSPTQVKLALEGRQAYVAQLVFDSDWQNGLPRRAWEWFNNFIGQTPDFLEPMANDASNFWEKLALIIKAVENTECRERTTVAPTTTTPTTTTPTTTTPTTTTPTTTTPTTTTPTTTTPTTTTPTTTTPTTTTPTTTTPTTTTPTTTTPTTTTPTTTTPTTTTPTTTTPTTTTPSTTTPSTTTPTTTAATTTTTAATTTTTMTTSTTTSKPCDCENVDPCPCRPEVVIRLRHRPSKLRLEVKNIEDLA